MATTPSHIVYSTIHSSSWFEEFGNLRSGLDPALETILLISEAPRTGASVLVRRIAPQLQQRYNIVVLLISEEDFAGEFDNCLAIVARRLADRSPGEVDDIVKRLLALCPIEYAIASNLDAGSFIRALVRAFVPVVTLVSELASGLPSQRARLSALDWSTYVVFADQGIADSAKREHPTISSRRTTILPTAIPDSPDAGAATHSSASSIADVNRCARWLDQLGQESVVIMRQLAQDFATLRDDPSFDSSVFLPPSVTSATREGAIVAFLVQWDAVGCNRLPATNFFLRRPCAGFHPQIYAHENADRYDPIVNPLAHFIRDGRPNGPWRHDVIVPRVADPGPAPTAGLRAAIHGHFFYPELAADFLRRLACNRARCDLWLTTNDASKATALREAALVYRGGNVVIRVVPNRGRDIGAFLTAVAAEIEPHYDVIGHIHGKRSPLTPVGEEWRRFLWLNLVGDLHPMMDLILGHFAADERLGIVFPEEPHLPDWDANLQSASHLAIRMGITTPLPPFFDFPVGTMFWARPQALKPLCELKLGWGDYPEEPVPPDGTLLHALERLLPFAAQHAGYRYATTHVPHVTWNGAVGTNYDLA